MLHKRGCCHFSPNAHHHRRRRCCRNQTFAAAFSIRTTINLTRQRARSGFEQAQPPPTNGTHHSVTRMMTVPRRGLGLARVLHPSGNALDGDHERVLDGIHEVALVLVELHQLLPPRHLRKERERGPSSHKSLVRSPVVATRLNTIARAERI